MLRIAVPNKGSLAGPAFDMLREAGYRTRRDPKELICTDPDNDVEFFYLRPRDIAVYVGSGTVDAGITGRDLLLDAGSGAEEVMALGFVHILPPGWTGQPMAAVAHGTATDKLRVLRGGGCCSIFGLPRAADRLALPLDYRDGDIGFRCAKDGPSQPNPPVGAEMKPTGDAAK